MKTCTKCGQTKTEDHFRWYPKKQYRNAQCKSCENQYHAEWRRKNKNRPSVKRLVKKSNLRRYGLTLEQYESMLESQGGVCKICGRPELFRMLSVDHNHNTGKVRGLLCTNCNFKLSVVEDSDFLQKAQRYLITYNVMKKGKR